MNYKLGFIGTGNMGGALALAASKQTKSILLSNRTAKKADQLAHQLGCASAGDDNYSVINNCKYIFIGVKPQYLENVLGELSPAFKNRKERFVLVSMVAGVTIEKIRNMLGIKCPVIRIMPNTACQVSQGITLYCTSDITSEEEAEFVEFMSSSGIFDKMHEEAIDAGSAIAGCGSAFAYMFMEALADGGVSIGLTKEQSIKYAAQMMMGAAAMALETSESPTKLKDAVCSPAGCTIAGVRALEDGAFRAACINAVIAAYERTKEIG